MKKGAESLSVYFLPHDGGILFKVHVSTEGYKKNCSSKGLDGASAFKLADESSLYLMKRGYICDIDLKNLPKKFHA